MAENNSLSDLIEGTLDRRRYYRRNEDAGIDGKPSMELIAAVADLKARVKNLEDDKSECSTSIREIEADIDNLKEVKSLVVAWSMVAGSISAIIYSNFTSLKKLFE